VLQKKKNSPNWSRPVPLDQSFCSFYISKIDELEVEFVVEGHYIIMLIRLDS
jgi:hypothetical protein